MEHIKNEVIEYEVFETETNTEAIYKKAIDAREFFNKYIEQLKYFKIQQFNIDAVLKAYSENSFKKVLKDASVAIGYEKAMDKTTFKNNYIIQNGLNKNEVLEKAYYDFKNAFELLMFNDSDIVFDTEYKLIINTIDIHNSAFIEHFKDLDQMIQKTTDFFYNINRLDDHFGFEIAKQKKNQLMSAFNVLWYGIYDFNNMELVGGKGTDIVKGMAGFDEQFYTIEHTNEVKIEFNKTEDGYFKMILGFNFLTEIEK